MGVCEAHLHQAYKRYSLEQSNHKPVSGYAGGLLKGTTTVPREQLGEPRFQPDMPDVLLSDDT